MAFGPDSALLISEQIIRDLRMYNDIFAVIGICYVGKVVLTFSWTLFQGIKVHLISKLWRPVDLKKTFGEWAVVTGCTDGVGKAYALELARRGLKLVLISRNMTKLIQLSETIESTHKVETIVIEADFSHGSSVYTRIFEQMKELDIGILVNNVGVISPHPLYVSEMPVTSIWEHINVNVGAVTVMSHMVLPIMLKKKKGAIINMSSLAAVGPFPLLSVYGATKVYVDYFSRAVHHELRGTGIIVQSLTPSYINTQMVAYSPILTGSKLSIPTPDIFVKHALSTLGFSSQTTGYWNHGIQTWLLSLFPNSLWTFGTGVSNKYFRKVALTGSK